AMGAAMCAALLLAPATAQERYEGGTTELARSTRSIQMGVGKSVVLDLPRDAAEIVVGNPAIANAIVRTPRKIYLMGAAQGQTTVFAVDAQGRQFAKYELSVGRDVGELGPLLKAAIPRSEIVTRTVNDTIILTGHVSSPADAQRAIDIAKGFATRKAENGGPGGGEGGGNVINGLIIRGDDQVMLKVTVAEVSRTVLKQLGVSANPTAGADTLLSGGWGTLTNNNPFAINTQLSNAALTLRGPGATSLTVQAFERNSVARILAEPTVTAVSGEIAKVMVGGEIAVPGPGSCVGAAGSNICTPSVVFKPYGVSLAFTPVVQAEGRILIHVGMEVNEVDPSTSVTYSGGTVPGFRTRKNETTVELPSGGSIATAGLIQQNNATAINGLPGLLNLPVLGALFRSNDYQRLETELLIVVTPYIVKPIPTKEVSRPDDNFRDASDPQTWLLGRINRLYASPNNPDLNQNYKGRIGFIHD
ncbi:MAG: type II and III secretion system protein family protein, partial [Methylocystis sp.]